METNKQVVALKLIKPNNLNLEKLIKPELQYFLQVRNKVGGSNLHVKNGKYFIKQIPAFYYFIHVLLERQHSKNKAERCKYDKSFVRMYSRDIEPFKSKNDFKNIWNMLKQLNVIECKDVNEPTQHRKSANAYYFNLQQEFIDSDIHEHDVMVKETIAEKINGNYKIHNALEEQKLTNSGNKSILHQFNQLNNIKFDGVSATLLSEQLLDADLIGIGRYNSCIVSINNIVNGRIRYSKSDVCNRLYSNVTGMPRELRQFIRDSEGKSMIEIDYGSFNAFVVFKIINALIPDMKSNAEKMAFANELYTYQNLLLSSDFYTSFHQLFFPDEQLSRDQIKEIVLKKWFNSKLNSKNKYRKVMKIKLPQITEIIDSLKADNYKNFSHQTMKLESELVNEIIYKKFIDLYPDAQLYSIFDSFLAEQKHAAQLELVMQEEGKKFFGITCVVKTKNPATQKIEPSDDLIMQAITLDDVEDILPNDIKTKTNSSENQLHDAFTRIFKIRLERLNESQANEQFLGFTNQINNLTKEEKELLMIPLEDISDSKEYWEQATLESKILDLCTSLI